MEKKDIVIIAGARTPFGKFGGGFKDLTAADLATVAAKAALQRSEVEPEEIDHVIFGNVMQSSGNAAYLARHVALRCEVPVPVPAYVVNRLCGSGFQSILNGAMEIYLGHADEVLVGGVEQMSNSPLHVYSRWGTKLGEPPVIDALSAGLTDNYCGCPMAVTAENLARAYEITREESDEIAYQSHMLAAHAWQEGWLAEEVVPVIIPTRKGDKTIDRDEHFRAGTEREKLGQLPPLFPGGQVTAGNSSGINDGAVALVMTTVESAEKRSVKPLGRLVSWGIKGVQPNMMGIGPAPATREALDRARLSLTDMDLIEVNEAFACQYLAVEKELGLPRDIVNVNGGAVALGHPLGASGSRLVLTLLHTLRRRGGKYGLATACIGGGQGIAVVVEAYS
jgi:acetyl-CoA acetyltransferase family protein